MLVSSDCRDRTRKLKRQIEIRSLLRISIFTNDSKACNIEEASQGEAMLLLKGSNQPVRTRRTKKPYAP
jgi:hypothetical protein